MPVARPVARATAYYKKRMEVYINTRSRQSPDVTPCSCKKRQLFTFYARIFERILAPTQPLGSSAFAGT
jgi:hypothetical protein